MSGEWCALQGGWVWVWWVSPGGDVWIWWVVSHGRFMKEYACWVLWFIGWGNGDLRLNVHDCCQWCQVGVLYHDQRLSYRDESLGQQNSWQCFCMWYLWTFLQHCMGFWNIIKIVILRHNSFIFQGHNNMKHYFKIDLN